MREHSASCLASIQEALQPATQGRPMVEAHECAPTGSHLDFGSAKTPVGRSDAEVEAVELERFADAEAAEAENHLRQLDPLDFEGEQLPS